MQLTNTDNGPSNNPVQLSQSSFLHGSHKVEFKVDSVTAGVNNVEFDLQGCLGQRGPEGVRGAGRCRRHYAAA